jgi:ABC-type transport system involved in multi-copper enzyme maturation permease subunit
MKKISSIFIGMIVTFIFLTFVCGGVGQAAQIIFFSILCTMGIGLVFWIPVFMGVGYIVMGIFRIRMIPVKQIDDDDDKPDSKFSISPNQQALLNYVIDARKAGHTKEMINDSLKNVGWKEENINKALESY